MYADINAGSSILAQRGAVLSDMNATRLKMNENLHKNLQGLGQVFKDIGERLEKNEQMRKENEFKQAAFEADKDYKQKSLDLQNRQLNIAEQKLPAEIKEIQASARLKGANAWNISENTAQQVKDNKFVNKIKEDEQKAAQEQKQNPQNTPQPQNKGIIGVFNYALNKITANKSNQNDKFFNRQ